MRDGFGETRCRSAWRLAALGPSLALWALNPARISHRLTGKAPAWNCERSGFFTSAQTFVARFDSDAAGSQPGAQVGDHVGQLLAG